MATRRKSNVEHGAEEGRTGREIDEPEHPGTDDEVEGSVEGPIDEQTEQRPIGDDSGDDPGTVEEHSGG